MSYVHWFNLKKIKLVNFFTLNELFAHTRINVTKLYYIISRKIEFKTLSKTTKSTILYGTDDGCMMIKLINLF